MASSIVQDSRNSDLMRKENYPEMTIDQQSAFYSYFNQASTMQFLAPHMFAQQTLMSSWPFHPNFFSGWPLATPMPYTSPTSAFATTNQIPEVVNNNYVMTNSIEDCEVNSKGENKPSNYSTYSGSMSPVSLMNDSVDYKKKDATKSKIFECKVCNKTFGYKHVLQNHEKVHTGEKSYRCTKCNKCFRRDHHLKVHMRLHSGERPYMCDFPMCNKQFVQVANLRRHIKTHDNANRLKIHEKFLIEDKLTCQTFTPDSNADSLDLRKVSQVVETTSEYEYKSFDTSYDSPMDLQYESPEQSEPEDLSTKSYSRVKEKLD